MADFIDGLLGYMKSPKRSQQMQGLAGLLTSANDRARAFNELSRAAAEESLQTGDIYGPKSRQVANILAEGYNPVGMFIGPSSKMFNKDMALKASQMSKKGATPQEIWKTTGTVKGPDGQWRQEISDAQSTLVPQQRKALDWLSDPGPAEYPVGSINDLIRHQEVLKAYPDLANIRASLRKGESASYFPNDGFNERIISPALVRQGELANPQATKSSTLHELQHAIQEREKFASGGSADDFAFMRDDAMEKIQQLNAKMSNIAQKLESKSLSEQEKQLLTTQYEQAISERADLVPLATLDPRQAYGNLMGEAEARLTQRRMDLTPEQRVQNFPFEYTGETGYGLDVPLEGLIQMDQDGTIIRRGLLGR